MLYNTFKLIPDCWWSDFRRVQKKHLQSRGNSQTKPTKTMGVEVLFWAGSRLWWMELRLVLAELNLCPRRLHNILSAQQPHITSCVYGDFRADCVMTKPTSWTWKYDSNYICDSSTTWYVILPFIILLIYGGIPTTSRPRKSSRDMDLLVISWIEWVFVL